MRVTSKGQVTIPKRLRERAGIDTGTKVEFREREGELALRKATAKRHARAEGEFQTYLDSVTGIVDLGMSTDEFMNLIRGE